MSRLLPKKEMCIRDRHTIVLEGGILCPGFVDGHSHSERPLLSDEPTDCKTMQGMATEKLGLDGMSPAPMRPIISAMPSRISVKSVQLDATV